MMLSSCDPSGNKVLLPDIPKDIEDCINKIIEVPMEGGALTKAQVFDLIAKLRTNDVAKTQCGQRLIKIYKEKQKGP
jgi:hypothetical protein